MNPDLMQQPFFFRSILLLSFPIISGSPLAAEAVIERPSPQPNVLLIISDDQGIGDFGFMGNTDVKTPNLDRLAAESALFTNCVVGPACSPSRASLMTGRNHLIAGVWGVGTRNNLLRDETLMPEFFKAAGYGTGYFGKRDGIYLMEMEAWERGCDEASHVTGYVHKDATSITHRGPVKRTGWTCDVDVDTSLDYIQRQGDGPWWVTTAFILPHLPWEADEQFVKPYREAGFSDLLSDFYGCVTQMDEAIGRLLRGLEDLGQADNTIVVFLSDNGPTFKGMSADDIASRNPLGLQGQKSLVWENGFVVPFMVRWPDRIEPGRRSQFISAEDILPTILDIAGIEPEKFPEHFPFDGISLREAVMDCQAPEVEREIFRVAISFEGAAGGKRGIVNDPKRLPMEEQHVVLRGPRFKLHSFAGGQTALYDLDTDPGETTDVSARFPAVASRYTAELDRQYRKITHSGRAYRLPYIKVRQASGEGYNRIPSGSALKTFGNIRTVGFHHIRGFSHAGDRVEYEIEVLDPGTYEVMVTGEELRNGKGWLLQTDGKTVGPTKFGDTRMVFESVEFPAGRNVFSLLTTEPGRQPEPLPQTILFRAESP